MRALLPLRESKRVVAAGCPDHCVTPAAGGVTHLTVTAQGVARGLDLQGRKWPAAFPLCRPPGAHSREVLGVTWYPQAERRQQVEVRMDCCGGPVQEETWMGSS